MITLGNGNINKLLDILLLRSNSCSNVRLSNYNFKCTNMANQITTRRNLQSLLCIAPRPLQLRIHPRAFARLVGHVVSVAIEFGARRVFAHGLVVNRQDANGRLLRICPQSRMRDLLLVLRHASDERQETLRVRRRGFLLHGFPQGGQLTRLLEGTGQEVQSGLITHWNDEWSEN